MGHIRAARRRLLSAVRPALVAVAAAVAVVTAAGPAAAAAPDGAPGAVPTQAQWLAEALRANPVYVTDQLPRVVPRSTQPRFAALARRTRVPTYVLVLPDQNSGALLGAVHDRLGRDGLYVLVGPLGVADARAFGVSAPAADAADVALYGLPYDAGPLRSFQEFADTIASGPVKAARRADVLRKEYGDTGKEVPAFYLDRGDRANQGFVTGIVLAGAPLTVLLAGLYVRGRRGRKGRGQGRPRLPLPLPETAVALALAAAVALGAARIYHQTVDSAAPRPTRADLSARLDRVAAGLAHSSVYTDPESPRVLDAARLSELRRRTAAFRPGPVRIAVVPQLNADESAGDDGAFVTALHQRLAGAGQGDGIYVVADPLDGGIDVFEYGLPLDAGRLTFTLPVSLAYDHDTHPADDHRLGQRLDDLMTFMGTVPRADAPSDGPDYPAAPVPDHRLPSLYHGDFWPGLLVGAVGAGLLLALTAAVTAASAALVRRRGRAPVAPARPSAGWLARTARREVDALAAELAAAPPEATERQRAWDQLDAAVILVAAPGAVAAADLAAAVVLARAGRAALAGRPYRHACVVNPLHGAAADDPTRRCAGCLAAAQSLPHGLEPRRLHIPGPDGRGHVPYEKAPGPLPAARHGVDRLVAETKEYASVQ